MLSGQAIGLHERIDSRELLLEDPVCDVEDEEAAISGKVLYRAFFDELERNLVQCDTIIWVFISLLLILAWGIGVIMLLYIPVRRYVMYKEISSRKLYVTPTEIVCKVTRPSFLPFLGSRKTEIHVPLQLVIDIIVEQGCLQSMFGLHTFRIKSIAHGKATPVDELQFQGVSNPELLRKVIITEAARSIREFKRYKAIPHCCDGESIYRMKSQTFPFEVVRMQSHSGKATSFPSCSRIPSELLLLSKVEEVMQSVKKIEFLVGKSKALAMDC